jgi:hypothetical protein
MLGHLNNDKTQTLDCIWKVFGVDRDFIFALSQSGDGILTFYLVSAITAWFLRGGFLEPFSHRLTDRIAPGMIFGCGCGGYEDARGYPLRRQIKGSPFRGGLAKARPRRRWR